MKLVMKFGGTSVSSGERIRNVAKLISEYSKKNSVVVVVSATGDTTDILLKVTEKAEMGKKEEVESLISKIEKTHLESIGIAIRDSAIRRDVQELILGRLHELKQALTGILLLKELTPKSKDYVLSFGERLSALILWGSLQDLKVSSKVFTGGEVGIVTDSNFGEAKPLRETTEHMVKRNIEPLLGKLVPVVSGYIAIDQNGVITTLGRGGSDYTATILGAALRVDEVWIWTDVDGLMTSDPRIVKDAKTLETISFQEAVEMAAFGAKAMHPRALEPILENHTSVRIRNTFNPANSGTLVEKERKVDSRKTIKSVLLVRNVGVVNITGTSMVGAPGNAARVFEALASKGINVMMISQSVSEANISLVVQRSMLNRAINTLELSLLGGGHVKSISSENDIAVIAVIGEGMRGTPGVAARIFGAISKKGINIRMIAQGSSELNISFAVRESEGEEAIRAIHTEFRLGE